MQRRPRVMGMIGGECTGKTTLALALASTLPGTYIDEQLRQWVARHDRSPLAHEQREVLELQRQALTEVHGTDQSVVIDTAPLMTAIYSAVYFQDDSLWDAALDATKMCTHLIWCSPDFPWQAEPGMRDGDEWRLTVHSLLDERMPELAAHWPVITVEGGPDARLSQVRDALRGTS